MKYSIGDLIIEITSEAKMIVLAANVYNIKFLMYLNQNQPIELSWKRKEVDKLIEEKLWKHYPVIK
jgi:hypothetical protein